MIKFEVIMFYVYLIQSEKDNSFYIGQTEDVEKRLAKHNSGKVITTKNRVPWKLLGHEEYPDRNMARFREYRLKRSFSEKKKFISKFCLHSSMDRA
ncbi:MAG: GIY-YIG nuclease family protein [bacterium]|nr:GIY-YIG nuclease family protein [bacterium]